MLIYLSLITYFELKLNMSFNNHEHFECCICLAVIPNSQFAVSILSSENIDICQNKITIARSDWELDSMLQISWWRHQLKTFSALLAICAGNSPVTGEFPAQRPVTRSSDVFFDLRLNERLNKQSRGWWFETPSRPLCCHNNVLPNRFLFLNKLLLLKHDRTSYSMCLLPVKHLAELHKFSSTLTRLSLIRITLCCLD